MDTLLQVLSLLFCLIVAIAVGKIVSKFGFPAILGWLVVGMATGPHAVNLLTEKMLNASWFHVTESVLEGIVGLMIGSELIWRRMKKAGPQIFVTTLTESLGTFLVVSLIFGIIFYYSKIPLYLALVFGGISLATAPAPSLSIVNEMKASGPVTNTLIPMAALDDLIGAFVFVLVIGFVSALLSTGSTSSLLMIFLVFSPVLIGAIMGWITGSILKKIKETSLLVFVMIAFLLMTIAVGFSVNHLLSVSIVNFMLLGMAFSTVFANMISDRQLYDLMHIMNPVIGFGLVVVILNLGAPLDYHLIFSAGLYTVVYILARAVGKYSGAYVGASITHAPDTVKKYLGLTLLPHSGVSLVFTGMAVSVLSSSAPSCASILQGTIAAAAVINEIIAVFVAKKGFEWAGELQKKGV